MSRHRTTALLAGLAIAAAAPAAAVAAAAAPSDAYSSVSQVRSALASDRVFIADDAEDAGVVDHDALKAGTGTKIAVAVLPQRAGDAQGIASQLTTGTGQRVAIVLVGTSDYGGAETQDGPFAKGQVAQLVRDAVSGQPDAESALLAAISSVRATGAALPGQSGQSGNQGNDSSGGGAGVVVVLVVLVLLAGGGVAYYSLRRRRRTQAAVNAERAEVESLYQRLGSDVQTLSPGNDTVAQQAMADASERFTATGALLARRDIDTVAELAVAKRTAVEGISAARVARQRLGLDPGPDPMPPPPAQAPQVQDEQSVQVGDQSYTGYGAYRPGAGHYFGGGYYQGGYVPGGWYATPFWETALISSIAFGGLGWGGGYGGGWGGGYGGGGYDQGYNQGYDQGQQSSQQDGGGGWDLGGGGGGDSGGWGGGGGDSGGWGGGGDSGGGGGGDGGGGGW